MNIRLHDQVLVRTGKYRGKTAKVIRVISKKNQVTLEKINIRTRHIKKRPAMAGQKIHYEAPLNVAHVMIICPHCSKATRVAHLVLKTGKKQRVCKKCHQTLDRPEENQKSTKR